MLPLMSFLTTPTLARVLICPAGLPVHDFRQDLGPLVAFFEVDADSHDLWRRRVGPRF